LALCLPQGRVPRRATVGRGVAQASRRAGGRLTGLAQCCQRWVVVWCWDDSLRQRAPICMAVEPHRMAWLAGQRGPDRSGERWGALVTHWPWVERVVTDAGTGLERGVKLLNEAQATAVEGQEGATTMSIQMGLDVWPPPHARQRVRQRQWRQAERHLEAAAPAATKVAQRQQRGREARGVAQQAWRAWQKAAPFCEAAVHAEAAAHRIATARAWLRPAGGLRDRQWAQAPLCDATTQRSGQEWGKVRRLLHAQRALPPLEWRHEQRAQAVAEPR